MASKAVGYVRVSTEEQARDGVSLDAQEAKIRAYAALYDLDLVAVVRDEGASAKTLDRPGLQAALAALRDGRAEAIVVAKLDRLTRSVRDLGALVDGYFARKFALMSVAENVDTRTAAGRLVLNVLGSVAQWEREAIGERTADALRYKRAKGERTGGDVPFGYTSPDGVRLVPEPREQMVIGEARTLRAAGWSLRATARELERRGFLPRSGKTWDAKQVARMTARAA